jgi:hypothetical protein
MDCIRNDSYRFTIISYLSITSTMVKKNKEIILISILFTISNADEKIRNIKYKNTRT